MGGYCQAPDCDQITTANLCTACTTRLRGALVVCVELDLGAELDTARTRQARMGRPTGTRARLAEPPLPYDDDAARVLDALQSTLAVWARDVAADLAPTPVAGAVCRTCEPKPAPDHWSCRTARAARPRPTGPQPTQLALWLLDHLDDLTRRDDAGLAADEIPAIVAEAERAVDLPPTSILAGRCPTCGAPVYAPPTAVRGYCRAPGCSDSIRVDQGTAALLATLDARELTAAEVARVMTALGEPVTRNQIAQWATRGTITPASVDQRGRPRYRVGEVRARRRAALARHRRPA